MLPVYTRCNTVGVKEDVYNIRVNLGAFEERRGVFTYVISMDWFSRSCIMFWKALSAIAYKCGGISVRLFPRYFITTDIWYTGRRLYGLIAIQKRPE